GMAAVDEVWTASLYNWRTFSKEHPRVYWIPHITGDTVRATADDIAAMAQRLGLGSEHFCVLNIGHHVARRKNVPALERAFAYLHGRHPEARLILKTTGFDSAVKVVHRGPVTWIYGALTDAQVAALYGLAQLYASPHCSEGWGLTLTDAMQHGVLTLATGYSGNMEFMTAANSLLLRQTPSAIRSPDLYRPFTPEMRWAYPHLEHLEAQLLQAYDRVRAGTHLTAIAQAKRDLRRFDARHIAVLVRARLHDIAHRTRA
ncbi:MAG: glycosyltransferase family 1 protein, partial [Deltaproteobacteria bacterium]